MVLLYAPGFTEETPAGPSWTSNQHTWFGWDGSEWDLSGGRKRDSLTMAGLR